MFAGALPRICYVSSMGVYLLAERKLRRRRSFATRAVGIESYLEGVG